MGLHLIPSDTKINFVGIRKISYAISIILILIGLASLVVKGGPRYGIDFAGGIVVQVQFNNAVSDEEVKAALSEANLPGLVVQSSGDDAHDYLLRIANQDNITADQVEETIATAFGENLPGQAFSTPRTEMVGPKVGADLRSQALQALYLATLLMSVYISGRFENRWGTALVMALALGGSMYVLDILGMPKFWQVPGVMAVTIGVFWWQKLAFALGAMFSTIHDILITVGIFSLLDKEFDLTIIAALLTVVGYSLNDTIIVFDRIRENLLSSKDPLGDIINRSINQTLSRTVLTSGTTLLVIVALLFLGGSIIFDFALALFIGVFVGTYSSIFVASPVLLFFEDTIRSRQEAEEEKRKRDARLKRGTAHV
ncbi:MAG: protein translocase subunit SecF [Deltaproteobacteria bacterium]|nr:protein translocase subunit SecF [Deltaproteobacteria bacterium]